MTNFSQQMLRPNPPLASVRILEGIFSLSRKPEEQKPVDAVFFFYDISGLVWHDHLPVDEWVGLIIGVCQVGDKVLAGIGIP